MYYTSDHEWINFQGTVAYMGVSRFKLPGFRAIQEIIFNDPVSYKKQGDIIAWIKFLIPVTDNLSLIKNKYPRS